ncbi:MAG: ORF6N domain-containing protein [Patescibacteria group bacterium]|jgi:hypothetical protein
MLAIVEEKIQNKILVIRDQKIMIDRDLAMLYGVETKVLLQSMKRNKERFPEDFCFQLNKREHESLRSQFVTSKKEGRGGRRYLPHAFTEQGVAMLSSVLKSKKAIQVNIAIMRMFIKLREIGHNYKKLAEKISEIEKKYSKQDKQIAEIFSSLRYLMRGNEDKNSKREIGFKS